MPLLRPTQSRASKTGDFCDAKITTPEMKLQPKKREKPAFLLGEIEFCSNGDLEHPLPAFQKRKCDSIRSTGLVQPQKSILLTVWTPGERIRTCDACPRVVQI